MSGKEDIKIYLAKMNVTNPGNKDGATALIAVVNSNEPGTQDLTNESLVITASIKPFINILWAGTVIMVLGFFLSILKRRKELK